MKLIYNNQRHLGAAIYVEAYVMHNPPKMTAKIFSYQTHAMDVQFVHRGSLEVAVSDADHEQYQLAFSIS